MEDTRAKSRAKMMVSLVDLQASFKLTAMENPDHVKVVCEKGATKHRTSSPASRDEKHQVVIRGHRENII